MYRINRRAWWLLSAVLMTAPAFAEDEDDTSGGDTMTIVDDGTMPEDIVGNIALPDAASDMGQQHAQHGLETAHAASEDGQAFGEATASDAAGEARDNASDVADQARDNASDVADSMRDAAEQMREDAQDHRPDGLPDQAGGH